MRRPGPRRLVCLLAASGVLGCVGLLACGDGKKATNLSVPDTTGTRTDDAGVAPSDATAGDGAPASDGEADTGSDAPSSEPAEGVYVCPATATWVDANTNVGGIPQVSYVTFSADELTAVWVLPGTGKGAVYYADRADRAAAFGAATQLSDTLGPFELDRAAVGTDGLSMVLVKAGRLRLNALVRASRSAAFADQAKLVADLNGDRGGLEDSGGATGNHDFHSPAMSTDAQTLLYVDYAPASGHGIYYAPRDPTTGFRYTGMLDEPPLRSDAAGKLRLPTGFSSDQRTIFFVDEVTGTEKVAWRTTRFKEFSLFADLGTRKQATPNSTCKRLYHLSGAGVGMSNAP